MNVTGNITATGTATFSGNAITIEGTHPDLIFTDTNNDDDFQIHCQFGTLAIKDIGGSDRLIVNSDGHVDITAGLDVTSGGLDVTGNATVSGDIDVDGHTNLDNVSVAGVVTATTFVGALTGSASGNAATATALQNARTIGGVSFDGTANINLPGVNAAGTQDTSGTAAVATNVTVSANNSTNETVYPVFVDGATGTQGAETDTGLTYNPSTGNLTSTKFTGDGSGLTGITASGTGIVIKNSGSTVGTAGTINFGDNLSVSAISGGAVTITAPASSGGISTISGVVNIVNDLNVDGHTNLDNVSISGFTTITQDLDVDGHTNLDNVSIAGVVTATTFSGSGASLTGIANANISASAAIGGEKINPAFTSNVTITNTAPRLDFVDSDNNSDYRITNSNGTFVFYDTTNGATRLSIAANGHVSVSHDYDEDAHT